MSPVDAPHGDDMATTPILIYTPGGGTPIGEPPIPRPPITNGELTQLVNGQNYIDVIFDYDQVDNTWIFVDCSGEHDQLTPLNIWPGIVTTKTATRFRHLNGLIVTIT